MHARVMLVFAAIVSACPAAGAADAISPRGRVDERARIDALNTAFLDHLKTRAAESPIAVATVRDGFSRYTRAPQGFVPDGLAVLDAAYRRGLEAFDAGNAEAVLEALAPLRDSPDPYLKANAAYFELRAMVDLGRYEEAEQRLAEPALSRDVLDAHTPYAPHLAFLRAFCEARNLRFDAAAGTLAKIREHYSGAPEAIQVGVRQMLLEIERREKGTLDEVATVMQYVADRLRTVDTTERVTKRQEDVLALLDKLIQEEEQKEQSQKGQGGQRQARRDKGKQQGGPQTTPKEESDAPEGGDGSMDLHSAPRATPGESWGQLPPAERERILQSIKERFPSRYRQLVEQYYRSLAEQK